VADYDCVLANQDLLDDQTHDALTLCDVKGAGIPSKPDEKRCERLGQTQERVAIVCLIGNRLQLRSKHQLALS
jgi:hypothetical protein